MTAILKISILEIIQLWNKICKLSGMNKYFLVIIWWLFAGQIVAQKTQKKASVDDYFYDAMTERLKSNYQKSNDLFEQCLSIDTNNDAIYFKIAQNYFVLKDYDNSLMYLKKAQKINPDNKWYQKLFIEIKIKQQTDSETLNKLIKDFIPKAKNKYLIRDLYLKVRQMQLEQIRSKPQATVKQVNTSGTLIKLWQQKQYNKLIKNGEQALEKTPDNAEIYLYMAKAYTALKKYTEARDYLDMGIDFTIGNKSLLKAYYQQYIEIYTGLKQTKKADKYRRKLQKI